MYEENNDIIKDYFDAMASCHSLNCQKTIFEPDTKKEWFFENDCWCYFEFHCKENYYSLKQDGLKNFDNTCSIKNMSYEIKMLLAYTRLRDVVSIEKEMFDDYVKKYENEKKLDTFLSLEKFNYNLRERENLAYQKADKIANRIMSGCLVLVLFVIILFSFALFSYLKAKYFS